MTTGGWKGDEPTRAMLSAAAHRTHRQGQEHARNEVMVAAADKLARQIETAFATARASLQQDDAIRSRNLGLARDYATMAITIMYRCADGDAVARAVGGALSSGPAPYPGAPASSSR